MDADFGGDQAGLKNGLKIGKIHGFDVYMSNNLPAKGTGPGTSGTANQDNNYGIIVAGHSSSVASTRVT